MAILGGMTAARSKGALAASDWESWRTRVKALARRVGLSPGVYCSPCMQFWMQLMARAERATDSDRTPSEPPVVSRKCHACHALQAYDG